jgi:hypothetical protein
LRTPFCYSPRHIYLMDCYWFWFCGVWALPASVNGTHHWNRFDFSTHQSTNTTAIMPSAIISRQFAGW